MDFRVVGYHDNIPSSASAIHVSSNGYCQEETHGIPFTNGITPNWSAWSNEVKKEIISFEQGEKYTQMPSWTPPKLLLTKHFYQVIKAPPQGVLHGIYRKFLGLTPGHTYRLTACLSTLDMDSVKGDWSFSIHAAPTGSSGNDLTSKQMAGLEALPDGRSGPEAACVASFGPGRTTKGEFDFAITGHSKLKDGSVNSHITLPADMNEIIVWVRFNCSDPTGKVGFSGVKLEDITAMDKVPMPEQIIKIEHQAELDLIRREEKALRKNLP